MRVGVLVAFMADVEVTRRALPDVSDTGGCREALYLTAEDLAMNDFYKQLDF